MAYVVERKNKKIGTKYRVLHEDKLTNKVHSLFLYRTREEAQVKADEINKNKDNTEYMLALYKDVVEGANDNTSVQVMFDLLEKRYIDKRSSDDDVNYLHVRSHLKRVLIYASELLNKDRVETIYLGELIAVYSQIYAQMNKKGLNEFTLRHSHRLTKEAISRFFGGDYKPEKIFDYKLDPQNFESEIEDEIDLTPEVFSRIYQYANPRLRRAMILAIQLGSRFGRVETQNIRYDDILTENDRYFIQIKNGKRKLSSKRKKKMPKYRVVPISDTMLQFLMKWKKEDDEAKVDCGYIIHWNNHKVINLGNAWRTAKEKAGLKGVKLRPYKHRHTNAQKLLDSGVDRSAIASMLGHVDTRQLDTVYGPDTRELQKVALPILNDLSYTNEVKKIEAEHEDEIIDAEFSMA
jgi:integrase